MDHSNAIRCTQQWLPASIRWLSTCTNLHSFPSNSGESPGTAAVLWKKGGAKRFSPTNKRELVCFLALPRDLPSSLFLRWMCVAVFVCKKEVGFCFLKKMKKSWWLALWRKCAPKAGRIGKDRFCVELVQRGITLSYALSYGMIVGFDASVHWMVELIFVLTFGNGILQSCSSEFISGLWSVGILELLYLDCKIQWIVFNQQFEK